MALSVEFVADFQEATVLTDTEQPDNTSRANLSAPGRARGPLSAFAAGVAAFGVSCGLSFLGSLGVAGAIVGLGAGSWSAVVFASIVAVVGLVWWRRRRTCDSTIGTTGEGPVLPVAGGERSCHEEVLR